jgi:hypothetical protein
MMNEVGYEKKIEKQQHGVAAALLFTITRGFVRRQYSPPAMGNPLLPVDQDRAVADGKHCGSDLNRPVIGRTERARRS